MSKQELLDRIEKKRAQLIDIVAKNGLTSPQAIQYSQELDLLLNSYNSDYIKNFTSQVS
ncbi:Spo0E like sporulation regulatory protein [[Bacillus] enclensis]|uniref:Spo0E like sporulation regulatory protein n=2 Tax=Rossellomorea TaxID=2837508 RepID=A0A1C4BKD0_9BACI|nr:aspartyl-phosphate phosphatase Spo0E family protein [[Bacillus] enclensis]MBH9965333.1 aspartyl-phosphate phosphatase Spo0E family protein [[Bacillus] enclensis]QTC42524.1 aspartyl-phosphate phosphatase Spo0E family protein [Bacillus sp. V3]QWC24617.1 Spo0E family sporulation regulatory protein-aspartic acid phosphatase [Bacillus haikouensis]SCC07273.1 Spo0E like sporulation regulatory protein [[Bacillus] enclensis]